MSNSVNFRANQRYKVLRSEQERRAKVFDRDMTSLMGYILGISCNMNTTSPQKPFSPEQDPLVQPVKNPTFSQYSSTRTFFRSETRCGSSRRSLADTTNGVSNGGVSNGGVKRSKERKHVRFKADPQIHIIESQPESWSSLQRPSSAPVHISKYPYPPSSDLRSPTPDTQSLSKLYTKTVDTTAPAYQFYPASTRHMNSRFHSSEKKFASVPIIGPVGSNPMLSSNHHSNRGSHGNGDVASKRTIMNKCWEGVRTKRRTRSCWEATKQNVVYHP